jgi:hypothetical protein
MVRSGRRRRTPGRFWSEIGVSTGVLLVPPLLVGAAVYGMLPAHEDEPARNSSPAAAEFLPADFASRSAFDISAELPLAFAAPLSPTTGTAIAAANPLLMPLATKPAAPPPAPAAAKPAAAPVATMPVIAAQPDAPVAKPVAVEKAAAAEPATFALASEHSELLGKDMTRAGALGPVPVQVTVVVAPSAETESGRPVSLGAAPPESIAALPPAPAAAPAARSAEPPREHHAGAPHGTRHFRHMARHNRARPDAHPEEAATQRAAEPPQHEFSLRNLFQQQQQGGRQKNAVRG